MAKWFLDGYLNIATNRKLNSRTDFISLLFFYENQFNNIFLKIGSGFIYNGNLGGSQIQNFYHRVFSIDGLALPYLEKTYFGLSINPSIKTILFKSSLIQLKGIISVSLYTGGGPNSTELGLDGNYLIIRDYLLFSMHLGYKSYFSLNKRFESFFGQGIVWGFFSTIRITKGIQSSFWVTGNQYGKGNQNHFGISFSFFAQKIIPISFDDISYP